MSAAAQRPRLLVLRALGLGDFLTGVPAYRALAAAFPDRERWLAAPAALAPLLAWEGSFAGLVPARPLAPLAWAGPPPEIAANLHGRGPESHRVLRALAPGRLLAFASPGLAAGPAWRADEHEVRRWCRMLAGHGIAADPDDLELRPPPGGDGARRARPAPGYVLLHPGAASEARRWPAARWAALAAGEARAGRRVVVSGGPDEAARAAAIAARAGAGVEARAGTLSLDELARLVAGAALVVCGDTGVGHLATALRRPSVLLFGPTAPAHWGPPASRPWHRVLWKGATGDPHARRVDPGLARISVVEVRAAIADLRARLAPAPSARRARVPPPVAPGAAGP